MLSTMVKIVNIVFGVMISCSVVGGFKLQKLGSIFFRNRDTYLPDYTVE
jgi:hypothetical protein